MTPMRLCPAMAAAALVLVAGQAATAQVIDATWINDTSGAWSDAARWSTPDFPTARGPDIYRAIIDFDSGGPYTISLGTDIDLDQLVYTSGDATIDGGGVGTLAVRTDIEFGDATIRAVAELMSEGTLRFTGSVLCEIDDTPACQVGSLARKIGTGDIAFRGSTVFMVSDASTFTVENSGDLIGDGTARFSNEGTFSKQSPGLTRIDGVGFENTGTVEVQQGTLEITNPILPSIGTLGPSTYDINAGAALEFTGTLLTTNQADVLFRGPGATFTQLSTVDLNQGLVQTENGATFAFASTSPLVNEGSLIANGPGSTISTVVAINNAGGDITVIDGGVVSAGGPGLTNNGLVQGTGTINAETFVNNGLVSPGNSPGILVTESAGGSNHVYQQDATGTLLIEIAGRTPGATHDVLDVRGIALIDGRLELEFSPFSGEPPVQPGDQFLIILADGLDGIFRDVELRGLGTEGLVDVFYTPAGVQVVVREVPAPGAASLLAMAGLLAARRRR